jgi:hypothetical protein
VVTSALLISALLAPVENSDRDVIEASMLSFFKHEKWHSADWVPKSKVYVRTQLRNTNRQPFKELVETLRKRNRDDLNGIEKEPESTDKREYILAMQKQSTILKEFAISAKAKPTLAPPTIIPLKSHVFDKKIVVADVERTYWRSQEKNTVERNSVIARVSAPSYSPDGTACIVNMSVPWSIHNADLWFLLKRNQKGWIVAGCVWLFSV